MMRRVSIGSAFLAAGLLSMVSGRAEGAGVAVGGSALIGTPDYSDTFTVGTARRPGSFHYTNPDSSDAYYDVETGAPSAQWHPTQNFSFNVAGNTVGEYPGSVGNGGAATGLAQSGGGDFNFAYGLRDQFTVQADAVFVSDHIRLGAFGSVGAQRGSANSLCVLFRRGSISLHNGVETATGWSTGIGAGDATWHNFAVEFDKTLKQLSIYVDQALIGTLNLATFAGGIYQNYSAAAVGAGVSGYVGWIDNFQVGFPKVSGSGLLIDAHRTETLNITGDGLIGALVDVGRLVKRGDGTLALTNACLYNGTVDVRAGTLALRAGAADLPEALRAGLVFWVDANRNVEVSGDEVAVWHDVREAAGGTTYPCARKFGSDPAPERVQGGADVAGNALIDFGAYGCGKWLQWQDAAGSRLSVTNIRTVFMAVSCTNGYGFLLGDWDDSIINTNAGTGDFHAGGNTAAGDPAGVALMNASWWGLGASPAVVSGQTFVNGVFVRGTEQRVSAAGEVLAVSAVGNAQASNFGNNRNFKASQGIPGVSIDRQGGGRIGEVLVYSSALAESQRKMVESYLMKKWLGRGLGTVVVEEGAALSFAAGVTQDVSAAQLSGLGRLLVEGAGRLIATNGVRMLPAVRLGVGASVDNGTPALLTGQPIVLQAGSEYAVSNGVCLRQALAEGDVIEKTGDGVMTAVNIPAGVRRISVKSGTLRLAPPAVAGEAALTSALQNASFEVFSSVGTAGTANWGYAPEGTGWTIRGDMTSTNGADWSGVGLAKPLAGVPWCASQTAPDGDWVIFIKRAGELERTFEVPVAGRYEIAFHAAARPNYAYHLFQVLVDATQVIGSVRTAKAPFTRIRCVTPVLAAGTHTLCFKGFAGTSDRASVIDGIEITRLDEFGYVAVPDGGFEAPSVLSSVAYSGATSYFEYNPAGTAWSFIGDPAVTNSGITEGNGPWYFTHLAQGDHAAFLRQTGELSVPVTFPTGGVYRLSFRAAARTGYWGNSGYFTWYNGHDFDIKLGTSQVARVTTWQPTFDAFTFTVPEVSDGGPLTQTLVFKGVNSGGGDRGTLIDEVCFYRMPQISNPGFETAATLSNGTWEAGLTNAGWTFCLGAGERNQSGIAKTGSDWGNTSPEGGCNAFLQMAATIRQAVTFEADGTYTLSFLAAGRAQQSRYLGHDFRVVFDGAPIGYVRTTDGTFRSYSFRLPRAQAGVPHILAFEGINSGDSVDRASFLDSVVLVQEKEQAFNASAYAQAELSLSSGARLQLDYGGTLTMAAVFYNGLSRSGHLDASNTPFIQGAGSLYVTPKGTLIAIQ